MTGNSDQEDEQIGKWNKKKKTRKPIHLLNWESFICYFILKSLTKNLKTLLFRNKLPSLTFWFWWTAFDELENYAVWTDSFCLVTGQQILKITKTSLGSTKIIFPILILRNQAVFIISGILTLQIFFPLKENRSIFSTLENT